MSIFFCARRLLKFGLPISRVFPLPNSQFLEKICPNLVIKTIPRRFVSFQTKRATKTKKPKAAADTESEILARIASKSCSYMSVLNDFSRKSFYQDRDLSHEFRQEVGTYLLANFKPSTERSKLMGTSRLLVALSLVNNPFQPQDLDSLQLDLLFASSESSADQDSCFCILSYLPLLNWSTNPDPESIQKLCQLVLPMLPSISDWNLTFLLHSWCCKRDEFWLDLAKKHVLTPAYLRKCQDRIPNFPHIQSICQILDAIRSALPDIELEGSWLQTVQERLLKIDQAERTVAATLTNAFFQIQKTSSVVDEFRCVAVVRRLWPAFMDDLGKPAKCGSKDSLLLCLMLRALSNLNIDPSEDTIFSWDWFWKSNMDSLGKCSEDQRVMVLNFLHRFNLRKAPLKSVQRIIDGIKGDNPAMAVDFLYSLARIRRIVRKINIENRLLNELFKSYQKQMPKLSSKSLVLGAWCLVELKVPQIEEDEKFWKRFYGTSSARLKGLTGHQQGILLKVLYFAPAPPPTPWLKNFIGTIAKATPETANGAAWTMWNFAIIHNRYLKKENNKPLAKILYEKPLIIKLFDYAADRIDLLGKEELVLMLGVMAYFGLDPTRTHQDIFDKFIKRLEELLSRFHFASRDVSFHLAHCFSYGNVCESNWFTRRVVTGVRSVTVCMIVDYFDASDGTIGFGAIVSAFVTTAATIPSTFLHVLLELKVVEIVGFEGTFEGHNGMLAVCRRHFADRKNRHDENDKYKYEQERHSEIVGKEEHFEKRMKRTGIAAMFYT